MPWNRGPSTHTWHYSTSFVCKSSCYTWSWGWWQMRCSLSFGLCSSFWLKTDLMYPRRTQAASSLWTSESRLSLGSRVAQPRLLWIHLLLATLPAAKRRESHQRGRRNLASKRQRKQRKMPIQRSHRLLPEHLRPRPSPSTISLCRLSEASLLLSSGASAPVSHPSCPLSLERCVAPAVPPSWTTF